MKTNKESKRPPIWLLLLLFFTLYLLISVYATRLLGLPQYLPLHRYGGIVAGTLLLAIGFLILASALKTLKLRRAFGKEIGKPITECKLITTGIYAYIRNPIYLGCTLLFLGWLFVLQLTCILILTFLYVIHFYLVAKWEEKELTKRFGNEYLRYKRSVPFVIPSLKKRGRG